jgi:repressor of nif and glnA expression
LYSKKENPTTIEIQTELKKKYKIETSEKLIRYHLNKLIDLNILERKNNKYYINPSKTSEKRNSLAESYRTWVQKQIEKELDNTSKSLEKLQEKYEK